jgi:peptidoglycan/LPS O-acetylase OafA/YrhL
VRSHYNNIGVLRLVLASAVIIGHAPEIMDGNRSREPLTQLVPHATLGGWAVTGFFLLSGYLITSSMIREDALAPYLVRRAVRIVPGYLVAFVLSVFVLAPMLGVPLGNYLEASIKRLVSLREPPIFLELGGHYPIINGPLWTISYEVRCYLLVAAFWAFGALQRRHWVLAITTVALVLCLAAGTWRGATLINSLRDLPASAALIGNPVNAVTFAATFLVGASVRLYRDMVVPRLTGRMAAASLLAAIAALQTSYLEPFGHALLLAAPVFWLAFSANLGPLRKVNDTWDISYGTYLYGWPIYIALSAWLPSSDLVVRTVATLLLAWAAGCVSWLLIEKPSKAIGEHRSLRATA